VRIRAQERLKAPIIMLTGHNTDSDTILGLETGANDYVTKPFRFAVTARAHSCATAPARGERGDAVFTIGPYTFRPRVKILLNSNGRKMRLTDKETGILRYLYRADQRPVSRETLLQEVWGLQFRGQPLTHLRRTSTGCGRRSRQDAANPAILVTEAGGYKLVP